MTAETSQGLLVRRYSLAYGLRLVARLMLAMLVAAGLWKAWLWIQSAEEWPVRQVRIEGELHHTSQAQMSAALDTHLAHGFIAVGNQQVAQATESLPWVQSANIHKIWPDTLVIQVVEHVAVARWNATELLNEYGERFSPKSIEGMDDLPLLTGPDGHEKRLLQTYADLVEPLKGLGVPVGQLQQSEHGSWRVVSTEGLIIEMGKSAVIGRLIETVSHLRQLGDEAFGQIKTLDMRYPNGVAVGWKDGVKPVWKKQQDPTVARGLARIGQV